MKILVLDLEVTVKWIEGRIDNSPKNPDNKCVMAQYGWLGETTVDEVHVDTWFHEECSVPDGIERLTDYLAEADVLVAHNAKFDCGWLLEMGFELPPLIYDTLIGEYLLAKGARIAISLKETAIRRRTMSFKKSDLVDEQFKQGIGFEKIPLADVIAYGIADVKTCGEIYLSQQIDLAKDENSSLLPVLKSMNETLLFLCEIEMNGVKIDQVALEEVKQKFLAEQIETQARCNEIVEEVMGDTPINLSSGRDRTKVIYSLDLINRDAHILTFNIGVNAAGKSLMPPKMTDREIKDSIRSNFNPMQKTQAVQCPDCQGVGSIQKYKVKNKRKNGKLFRVQGDPYKNRTKCKVCDGAGALYQPTGQVAGLQLEPKASSYASANGFKTDKLTLKSLISQAERKGNTLAVEFLTKVARLNAISTYLDSFIAGIERGTRENGLLHPNFNQCITATGRLSSGGGITLNLQNMPKRGFPVRKAIVSRFGSEHLIVEADYSGLEFRTACELSRDGQGIADIIEGKDIHSQTASIIYQKGASEVTKEERQQSKAFSFLPLFGGTSYGHPPHIAAYLDGFYDIYEGIHAWHDRLMTGTLKNGIVQTPSGRQYFWPNVVRTRNNRVTSATQILNYPVQGFSADLVQLACLRAFRMFKAAKLKSKLILTVHDSICVDCFSPELQQVKDILTEAMTKVGEEAKERFGYSLVVPLDIEISGGKNWLEQTEYA